MVQAYGVIRVDPSAGSQALDWERNWSQGLQIRLEH
jgi:hypothetical protein